MTEEHRRAPNSDPEAEGLPEYADDDSNAYDDADTPREADGPEPAPLPPDRDEGPLALDEFGLTRAEEESGEPLDVRLAREQPDVQPGADDRDLTPADLELLDEPPVQPYLDSEVSMYDRTDPAGGGSVGRLVAPDAGEWEDTEPDAVASDAGMAGGGETAEESAVHPVLDEDEMQPGEPGDGYV